MGKKHRLGALQVRVAWHDGLRMPRPEIDECALEPAQCPRDFRDFRAQVQAADPSAT